MADQSPFQEFHTHMMAGFEQMLRMCEHMVQVVPMMGGVGHLVQNAKRSFEAAKAAAEAAWHADQMGDPDPAPEMPVEPEPMPAPAIADVAAEPMAAMDAGVPVAPEPDHTPTA